MKRKLMALLILAAMLVCLLPTAAFAVKPGDALPYSKYCSACGQTALHMYLDGYTKGTYNANSGDYFHIIHAHDDWEHTLDHEQRCFTPQFGDYTIEYAQLSASSGQDPARYHKATCVCGLSLNKEHNYSEYQSGSRTCSDCGYVQTCDHSGNTNPTCLSTTCSVCGGTVPKTEHIRAQFKHDERGHWAYCTKCDSILSRVLPHTWDNGVVTDPGTCLAPGSMKYTCTACGETKTESITGEHDYKDAHDKDNHYQECSVCHDKKNVEAHKWDDGVVTQEPTCLVSGTIKYTCTVCSETKTESVTGDHDYKDAHDKDSHYQECSVCHDKKNVEAHKWNEGVVTQEPNCLVSGIIEYTCTVCGAKDCNDLEGDHDYKDAHDADNHYQECSVCHDKKNVEAHKWDEGVVTDTGTCVTPGSVKYTCTVCGETKTESVTVEHDYKDTHYKDSHYQECSVCHDKKDVEAHKFVWKIDRAATTTKEGEKHEECSVCGYKKAPVSIEKLSPAAKPRTGDASIVWLVLLVSTGSAAAAVVLYTKRKLA